MIPLAPITVTLAPRLPGAPLALSPAVYPPAGQRQEQPTLILPPSADPFVRQEVVEDQRQLSRAVVAPQEAQRWFASGAVFAKPHDGQMIFLDGLAIEGPE